MEQEKKENNLTPIRDTAGQPTKFKEDYPQMLIEHMANGYSFATFGAIVDVSRQTLYKWLEDQPEFQKAYHIGKLKCQIYWERSLKDWQDGKKLRPGAIKVTRDKKTGEEKQKVISMEPTPFNGPSYMFNMKNRFPEDFKDKQEIEHSGPGGSALAPVVINIVPIAAKKETEEKPADES